MDAFKQYDEVFNPDYVGDYQLSKKDILFIETIKKE